ncbi:conserved hypothetical protein [Candidatus Liberibacter solanacearum]|uniref:hypothetical protein n=1 Tax=Candidatus Liberibacter solanacearum TaxID=556287 RepID=UPI0038720510
MFSQKSVWKFNSDIFFKNRGDSVDAFDCIITSIKESGGTIEAVQAAKYLSRYKGEPTFVSGYRREGLIDILDVQYTTRANGNCGMLLVPSKGPLIDIQFAFDQYSNLYNSSVWKNFLNNHPDVSPNYLGIMLGKEQTDKGMKLIFSYAVRTCHACDDLAFVDIGYSFTNKGEFIGTYLAGIRDIKQ